MKPFSELYTRLDETNRTSEKLAALRDYFAAAPAADAAWALHFLLGRKFPRAVNTRQLREWVGEEAALPLWLVEESYHAVGDLGETLALLLPPRDSDMPDPPPLHILVEERLRPLREMPEPRRRETLLATWRMLDRRQAFVWNKILTGEFRVGVAATLVSRALAGAAGIEPAEMAHRLMGDWTPTAAFYERLMTPDGGGPDRPGMPYPFFLAHPLTGDPAELGDPGDWQAEWKWDGIRAQLIHRRGEVMVWSRGEELVNAAFPEIETLGGVLPAGTVLDGEILAWTGERPLPFGHLQRRLGRKQVSAALQAEFPVAFIAYDLLEEDGADVRALPLAERRLRLEALAAMVLDPRLVISPRVAFADWAELARLREGSRERAVEGFMLKRLDAPYGTGRPRGPWWKWKIDPFTVDAVLVYAQRGHGRRASLYTDYTFACRDADGRLVPVAKAYSGLTDEEIHEVDRFVRAHTLERHGPVRVVEPLLVFELAFEGIRPSSRHKSGVALRFPRMARWRRDKLPADADTIETLRALIPAD